MSLGLFGSILQAVAGAFSVYSAIEERNANRKAGSQAKQAADIQARQKKRELDRLRGSQRVAYAKAGVKLDGTPTAVIEDSQEQGQIDIDLIKLNGDSRADIYKSKATQSGFDALVRGAGTTAGIFEEDKYGVSLASRLF